MENWKAVERDSLSFFKMRFDMAPFTKDEQAVFMGKLVALQANAKIRETLHTLADLFHIYYIKT